MITLDYYGVKGEGRTITDAKKNAGEKIRDMLAGRYDPTILTYRGQSVVVFRTPAGWDSRTIHHTGDGYGQEKVLANGHYKDEKEAIRKAKSHLAQQTWKHEDGKKVPEFIKEVGEIDDYLRWIEFQMRYKAARDKGLSDHEAHMYGCGSLGRQDLIEKVEK